MKISTDVLIVGTGIAGLYAALNLDKHINVTMITKSTVEECNTYLAQGGISTARGEQDEELFIMDTLKAGKNKNTLEAVEVLVHESMKNINKLIELGVEFDKNEQGTDFDYTREGAHSVNRIVHCADETGKRVFEAVHEEIKKRKNINIIEKACLVDILQEDNQCVGCIALNEKDELLNINSKVTILASGGIGGLFKNSTNQRTLTGDGISIALRNNIKLKDLEYIQFHPTALYEDKPMERRFLISESLRGEGGKLVNIEKKRFVNELLPRDVVSKAIYEEENKTKSKYVYIDITDMNKEFVANRFPTIYKGCENRGVDMNSGFIPVTPVQHYFMGGIYVDTFSKTSMKNLFACGEVSCTGVHGANRLASNSLLEALVFSRRAAECINGNISNIKLIEKYSDMSLDEIKKQKEDNKILVSDKFKSVMEDNINELVNC